MNLTATPEYKINTYVDLGLFMVDPWRDCDRQYDDHCADRMQQRHLPPSQMREALLKGKKIPKSNNEFVIKWRSWTIKVTRENCFLKIHTAFLS